MWTLWKKFVKQIILCPTPLPAIEKTETWHSFIKEKIQCALTCYRITKVQIIDSRWSRRGRRAVLCAVIPEKVCVHLWDQGSIIKVWNEKWVNPAGFQHFSTPSYPVQMIRKNQELYSLVPSYCHWWVSGELTPMFGVKPSVLWWRCSNYMCLCLSKTVWVLVGWALQPTESNKILNQWYLCGYYLGFLVPHILKMVSYWGTGTIHCTLSKLAMMDWWMRVDWKSSVVH